MGANNVKEENANEDFAGALFDCMGARKETGDIRIIRSSTLRPTGRFEAGTSHGLRWSERAHSHALRIGVADDQGSTLEGGTRAKTPQKTSPVGIYSSGRDLDPWGSTASSPTRSILRSQDHPYNPLHPRLLSELGIYNNGENLEWLSRGSSPTRPGLGRSILRSQDHPLHPLFGEEQSKRVAIYDSDTRSASSRSSSLSCRSGQSVDSRRSGQSRKEKTKREALEHLAARIKGVRKKTQDELKKKVEVKLKSS